MSEREVGAGPPQAAPQPRRRACPGSRTRRSRAGEDERPKEDPLRRTGAKIPSSGSLKTATPGIVQG